MLEVGGKLYTMSYVEGCKRIVYIYYIESYNGDVE